MIRALAPSCLGLLGVTVAQDLEPRRWTHLPVGTNVLGVGYAYAKGDISFDPVLRIEQATVELHTASVAYSRYFPLFDTTARLDGIVSAQTGEWQGLLDGVATAVDRAGLADPVVRLSVNLTGQPALRDREFVAFLRERDVNTAIGVAVEVRLPLGEYMEDKLVNLGQNRFVVTPQLGVLHTRGPWSFELTGSVFCYTDNDEFFGGNTLAQDPLVALQGHVVRTFDAGCWLSAGVAHGWAGESTINGVDKGDEKRNLLVGASFGFRVGDAQSIRVGYVRSDARTETGADTDTVFVGWTWRF